VDPRASWPALIGALIRGETLTAEECAWAMGEVMDGAATPVQIAGFIVALRAKGETVSEVSGLARAMLEHAAPISVPGPVADLVGTGGDGAHTVNISTMGMITAAAAGARIPTFALLLAVALFGYVIWTTDRLTSLAPAAVTVAAGGRAPVPSAPAMSLRLAAGCEIVMGVAMGYMLITML